MKNRKKASKKKVTFAEQTTTNEFPQMAMLIEGGSKPKPITLKEKGIADQTGQMVVKYKHIEQIRLGKNKQILKNQESSAMLSHGMFFSLKCTQPSRLCDFFVLMEEERQDILGKILDKIPHLDPRKAMTMKHTVSEMNGKNMVRNLNVISTSKPTGKSEDENAIDNLQQQLLEAQTMCGLEIKKRIDLNSRLTYLEGEHERVVKENQKLRKQLAKRWISHVSDMKEQGERKEIRQESDESTKSINETKPLMNVTAESESNFGTEESSLDKFERDQTEKLRTLKRSMRHQAIHEVTRYWDNKKSAMKQLTDV